MTGQPWWWRDAGVPAGSDGDAADSDARRVPRSGCGARRTPPRESLRRARSFAGGGVIDREPPGYEDVALGLLVGVAVVAGVLWVGGLASAWSSGHRLPHGDPLAGLGVLAHIGDPSAAWHSPVGTPETYWACTAATIVVAGSAVLVWWRLWRSDVRGNRTTSPVRAEGLAPRNEVRRAVGARTLVARSGTLRPSLPYPRPADVGYHLGTSRGVGCWASVEDSMLLLGPPRSGKGRNVVIPMILDAPGAVVTTSTRPDNLAITLAERCIVRTGRGVRPATSRPSSHRGSRLCGGRSYGAARARRRRSSGPRHL